MSVLYFSTETFHPFNKPILNLFRNQSRFQHKTEALRMFSNFYFEKSVLMSLMMIIRPLARGATADKHLCCDWLKARPACGWLGASVIDSSTWVVGGSDRPVAVETNTASRPANRRRGRAPGIHLTHAEDFLSTRTHINTHRHTHTYSSCALLFG